MAEYIDRAAVLEILDDTVKNWKQDCGLSKAEYSRIRIKNLPTADVRPVVRGKWIVSCEPGDMYPHMNCSVCNFYWREIGHRKYFKFCPNCEADMRGDRE